MFGMFLELIALAIIIILFLCFVIGYFGFICISTWFSLIKKE